MSQDAGSTKVFKRLLSREQMQAIEAMFPTKVLPPASTEAELRHYMGQQHVLTVLRGVTG